MPQVENRQALVLLAVLLLAVPAQYYFSHAPDSSGRHIAFRRLFNMAVGFRNRFLSLEAWSEWCQDLLAVFGGDNSYDPDGESPALEVLQYNYNKDQQGHFASSNEPRTVRPVDVKFRVGQVVYNKVWNYRGVIIGWDLTARAPKRWLQNNHPPSKKHWSHMPNYAVLVDTRDRLTPQMTYVPQENLEVIDKTRIMHPSVERYFELYEGGQYVPRPWLQWIYPED